MNRQANAPLVSILMCAYNSLPFLKDACNTVLHQSYRNWELLICDDGSSDGTADFINTMADQRIRVYKNLENIGYQKSKNKLHKLAGGQYITQLDADDLYGPRKIELQVKAAANHQASIVACGYSQINTENRVMRSSASNKSQFLTAPLDLKSLPFWFPSLLVSRNVFDEVGYFDEYFSGAFGDDMYWTTKASERYPIYCLSDIQYHYRYTPGSITNTTDSKRKLIITSVVSTLQQQRTATGTDYLEAGAYAKLAELERQLMADKSLMHRNLLISAAKHVDHGEFNNAYSALLLASSYRMSSLKAARVIFYLIRRLLTVRVLGMAGVNQARQEAAELPQDCHGDWR